MPYLDQVILLGHAGRDGEVTYTNEGKAFGRVSVAVDNGYMKDGQWQEKTVWLKIVGFGYTGENISKIQKGDAVFVLGRHSENKWTDKEGVEHNDLRIQARNIKIISKSGNSSYDNDDSGSSSYNDEVPF